jgi:hypothetical protein
VFDLLGDRGSNGFEIRYQRGQRYLKRELVRYRWDKSYQMVLNQGGVLNHKFDRDSCEDNQERQLSPSFSHKRDISKFLLLLSSSHLLIFDL